MSRPEICQSAATDVSSQEYLGIHRQQPRERWKILGTVAMTLSTSIRAVKGALMDSGKTELAMESVSICRCRGFACAVGVGVGVGANVDGPDRVVRSWARGVRGDVQASGSELVQPLATQLNGVILQPSPCIRVGDPKHMFCPFVIR